MKTWKVVLENPRLESGTNTHYFNMGDKSNILNVKFRLLRLYDYDNKSYMYYEQDIEYPYLHSIEVIDK